MDKSSVKKHGTNSGFSRQIRLLLWKNFLIRKRHWITTILEVLLPTVIALCLAVGRTLVDDENKNVMPNNTIFAAQPEEEILREGKRKLFRKPAYFAYVPSNNFTDQFMDELIMTITPKKGHIQKKSFVTELEVEEFNDEAELASVGNGKRVRQVPAVIVFKEPFTSFKSLEDLRNYPGGKLEYVIRLPSYNIETRSSFPWQQFAGPSDDNAYSYVASGFSGLQIYVDKLLIKHVTGSNITTEINAQVFPYPPYERRKGFDQVNALFVPLLMIIGFVFIVPSIVIKIVSERETGIKELMKIMGLPNWMHWLGWMINSLLVLTISITIVTFFLFYPFDSKVGPVMPYSDPTVWWMIFFFYIIAATSYCFFISVILDNAASATALGIVSWLVFYLAFAIPMEQNIEHVGLYQKLASCLFPNVALHWAIKAIYSWETRGVGAQWGNLFQATSPLDGFALYHAVYMLMIDAFLFITLTVYLENILPAKYGIRKPFYYIFQKQTWFSNKNDVSNSNDSQNPVTMVESASESGFEKDPQGIPVGVDIQDLSKVFGNKKRAVDGVTLKIYEGQITALVGHNGAGKTTTLSIITGLFPPTSGTATVKGHDIRTEMDEVRESLGLCPQHNMLFDKLTVWEHMILFGRMKGLNYDQASTEATILINKLDLKEKTHYMSCDLSGGQKRKLSLGMALIGGSKVVILDECTSGMDPEARRVIWDLLLEMRGERTIILTTHFMEEADILGDRIAMMAGGKIKCCGTPLFLKKFYGSGYMLKMTTVNDSRNNEILSLVQSFISNASLVTKSSGDNNNERRGNKQSEMSISVPSEESMLKIFPSLFKQLESDKESLGIITMGLSLSTIDQVFLKIGEMEAEANGELHREGTVGHAQMMSTKGSSFPGMAKEIRRPKRVLRQQIYGLLQKKIRYTFKNKKLLFSQFIVPPFLLILAIVLGTQVYSPASSSPSLNLNISQFKTSVTYYTADDENLGDIYANLVGVGGHPKYFPQNTSLITELLKVADQNLGAYRDQYMIAATLNSSIMNAMYNSIPYHSAPISINLVTNTLLKSMAPNKDYSIDLSYQPLENKLFSVLLTAQPNPTFTLLVPVVFGTLVPIGLALFAASYVVYPTEERLSSSMQLQLMTGLSPVTFWFTAFIWDFFIMALAILVMGLCFPVLEYLLGNQGAFTANGGFVALMVVLIVYGYSALSFSYLFSSFAPSTEAGFSWVTIIHVFTGLIAPIFIFFLDNANLGYIPFVKLCRWTFRLFTSFGGSTSIMRFASIATSNSRCNILTSKELDIICDKKYTVDATLRQCCPNCHDFPSPDPKIPSCFEPKDFFSPTHEIINVADGKTYEIPSMTEELICVAIMALIYNLCIIVIEWGIIGKLYRKAFSKEKSTSTSNSLTAVEKADGYQMDEDVVEENRRVHVMTKNEDALVVCNLSKNFGRFAAVREINFGVHYGECFGLLGVNGAGKTTTFRMLTGDEIMSSGNAFCFMNVLNTNKRDFLSNIGYCPQFDAIIGSLSGKEMLELFCHLRGVPYENVDEEVDKWLHKLGLEKSANVPCESYSGGMKRRLSVGIAMIGDPPVVLLDEPTSGVDPVSRRQFWDVISSAKASGQSVILTSHSMDEIEVLCSRLGIMVNGRFQCLGSVEYLRNKFAHGYTLVIRLRDHYPHDSPIIAHLNEEVTRRLAPCLLQDVHQNVLQYQIQNSSLPWDVIFGHVEELKSMQIPSSALNLTYGSIMEDYTVSLTSLEEVFLSFARKQYSERNAEVESCFSTFYRNVLQCRNALPPV